jgi:hypothetical protein
MKTLRQFAAILVACATLVAVSGPARAEAAVPATAAAFSTAQLEQLVAPIALYPDALLTQILMASTYPLEIVEAQRWRGKNPTLEGDALDAAMKDFDWDPSVKSLAHLPDVLTRMNDNLDWTQDLGDAFLGQQAEVMDTVQRMRGKAKEAGNLKTTEQQVVKQNPDQTIIIESSSPEVIYVPTYSPTVVYGSSWYYPTWYYPPMYPYYPPGAGLITFGVGMAVGAAIWGDCNWGWGDTDINIDVDRYNEFNRNTNIDADRTKIDAGDRGGGKAGWNHDPSHRKGVNYKSPQVAQQYGARGGSSRVSKDQARGWSESKGGRGTGGAQAGTREAGGRTGAAGAGTMDGGASAGKADRSRSAAAPSTSDRGASSASRSASSSSRSSAYSGSRSSSMDRAASSRGSMSRGGTSFSGGGMRGGGGRRR